MSQAEIAKTLSLLFPPGSVLELRALRKSGGMASGYYTDINKLAHDAEILDFTNEYAGIYVILNKINPVLFSRRANRVELRLSKEDKATSDEDILQRWWFPIDIDPKRPSGISSSDEEHDKALYKAGKIREFLSGMGWPEPVLADSGNGAHLLYRIDLPNDPESVHLIRQGLNVLSAFFSDEFSSIDTSVGKAAQLWKLYGTMAKKGDSVADRPHRRSRILSSPESFMLVPKELLVQLASLLPAPPKQEKTPVQRTTDTLDLGDWLNSHGLSFREKPYGGGRLFLFDQCPFSSAHSDGAYAIQFDNGAIFAGCHHNSCGGGEQRWQELRERYEGPKPKKNYEDRMKKWARERAIAKAEYYGNIDEPGLKPISQLLETDISEKAREILHYGDPIEYIRNSVAVDHEGDDVVSSCLIMSFASRSVLNSNGLHVLVTGESGKGKSHIFDTMIQHLPPDERLDGRLSNKALFYTEGLKPGTAICLDDMALSESMQETLKGVTTSFKRPFIYRTVNKDRKGQVCIIPERCVWWIAKVDGTGDEQVWNRMLTCWIDDSAEQDERVLARELASAEEFPEVFTDTRKEVLVCHEICRQVQPVHVVIPYAKRIRFTSSSNRRNPGMLLDLIKSHAALFQFQRQRVNRNGVDVVIASKEDFNFASLIYLELNSVSGGQITKLTKSESKLIELIRSTGKDEFTMKELVDMSGKTYEAIRKLLRGKGEKSSHCGLLEKCPAITYLMRTDMTDSGNRSQLVYVWNEMLYRAWSSGGGCWLAEDKDLDGKGSGNGGDGDAGDGNVDAGTRLSGVNGNFTESREDKGVFGDVQACSCSGKTDLVTGETGESETGGGENFSPPKEGYIEEYSKNKNNIKELVIDRRKFPGAESPYDPVCSPLFPLEIFLRSVEKSESENNLCPVLESEQKSGGEKFSPVFSDHQNFSPVTPVTPVAFVDPVDPVTLVPPATSVISVNPGTQVAPATKITAEKKAPSMVIDPDDYWPINGVWSGPCIVCGGKWVYYTEKFSQRMKAENRFSYKVCKRCYEQAVERKSRSFTSLPGLLNVADMVRADRDIGRCNVCNTGPAVWIDPSSRQKICQICYEREKGREGLL